MLKDLKLLGRIKKTEDYCRIQVFVCQPVGNQFCDTTNRASQRLTANPPYQEEDSLSQKWVDQPRVIPQPCCQPDPNMPWACDAELRLDQPETHGAGFFWALALRVGQKGHRRETGRPF